MEPAGERRASRARAFSRKARCSPAEALRPNDGAIWNVQDANEGPPPVILTEQQIFVRSLESATAALGGSCGKRHHCDWTVP